MKENLIYWAKVKPQAVIPSKREEDAGFDLYPCFDEDYMMIYPHQVKMIPLGIASAFCDRYVVLLKERGSTGTKNIAQRSGVIDSGYRGEYMCPVSNLNHDHIIVIAKRHVTEAQLPQADYPYRLIPYEKAICQALILELPKLKNEEISYEQLLEIRSERMDGKLGSSGK